MFDAARQNILSFIEKNPDVEKGILEALLATHTVVGVIVVVGGFVILVLNLRESPGKAIVNKFHLSSKVFFLLFSLISYFFVVDAISFELIRWAKFSEKIEIWIFLFLFFMSFWFLMGDEVIGGIIFPAYIILGISAANIIVAFCASLVSYFFFGILYVDFSSELIFIDLVFRLYEVTFGFTLYSSVFLAFFSGVRREFGVR